jgi:superfamily II DNA/RNA helicase
VATDVAARGLDVSNINYVINYSTPQSYSDYVHRIGRAGRAGKIGYALTFIQGR